MSTININTYDAQDGVLAIAVRGAGLVSNGGLGLADTERAAVEQAVRSLFMREAAYAAADASQAKVVHDPEPDVVRESAGVSAGEIHTSVAAIEGVLRNAAAIPGCELRLTYRDARGNVSLRRVKVAEVESDAAHDYVKVYDLDIDEPRTFRLDRVEAVEAL